MRSLANISLRSLGLLGVVGAAPAVQRPARAVAAGGDVAPVLAFSLVGLRVAVGQRQGKGAGAVAQAQPSVARLPDARVSSRSAKALLLGACCSRSHERCFVHPGTYGGLVHLAMFIAGIFLFEAMKRDWPRPSFTSRGFFRAQSAQPGGLLGRRKRVTSVALGPTSRTAW